MGLNHTEALDKIEKISKKDSPLHVIKKDLIDVLSMTDENSYQQVLDGVVSSYDKATGGIEKRNLQFASPLINSYIEGKNESQYEDKVDNGDKSMGIVTLIRESDSTGKYKVYKYQVKNGGYPKDIIRQYKNQIGGGVDGMKITDSKGKEYGESTKFTKGENVYIKVPKEKQKNNVEILDDDIKEKISIQENYIEDQTEEEKKLLEKFSKEYPMGKDVELSFGIPVYKYEDIEKTLSSITTKQTIDPKRYEIVFLLNRPSDKVDFDKTVKEKILKFKLEHPEYNINIFEHTFNFKKNKEGKYVVNYGKLYKTLADTIVYRNIQRKNIKGMDATKIRNLIIKTGAADSTDKNPKYIENQLEKYSADYLGKELVSMRGESRLPADVCKAYPLIEILEFFQRNFDNEYAGGPLNRDVGIGSYKSRIYCDAKGFRGKGMEQGEDVALVKDIKKSIKKDSNTTMHYDSEFVGAVDESCDRGIWAMVENNQPYCDRYLDTTGNTGSKEKNWNKYAIEHKGEEKFKVLELTKENLEKNLSGLYKQRIDNIFREKTYSRKYRGEKNRNGEHISGTGYLDNEGKNATSQERAEWIAKNVVNPIMEKVLSQNDFMGLDKGDYDFGSITTEIYYDKKEKKNKYRVASAEIKFKESAITKIQQVQQQKIKNGYYDYRK